MGLIRNANQVLFKKPKEFMDKLNNYIVHNNIEIWSYGYDNAKLVVDNYFRFTDIFSMLDSMNFMGELSIHLYPVEDGNELLLENFKNESFPFCKSNLSQKDYFNKCIKPQFKDYLSFVRSAFFYILKDIFHKNKKINLVKFSSSISPFFIQNTLLSRTLINDLWLIEIVQEFPLFFVEKLNLSFNNDRILRICNSQSISTIDQAMTFSSLLIFFHFHFSKQFVFECVQDCIKSSNIVPLLLALRIYEIKLAIKEQPVFKNEYVQSFQDFQKFLISNKLIKKKFLTLLLKKNNYFKEKHQDVFKTMGIVCCGLFASSSFLNSQPFLLKNLSSNSSSSLTARYEQAAIETRSTYESAPGVRKLLQGRLTTAPNLQKSKLFGSFKQLKTLFPSAQRSIERKAEKINANWFSEKPVFTNRSFTHKRKLYTYQTFEDENGRTYWSPYGISGSYRELRSLLEAMTQDLNKKYTLFGRLAVADHIQKLQPRIAFNLSEEEAQAVIVPYNLNPVKTNNRELIKEEYRVSDYRFDPDTPLPERNIHQLFINRQKEALAYVFYITSKNALPVPASTKAKEYDFREYHIIYPYLEEGYMKALSKEYFVIGKNFCDRYNFNIQSIDSYLAFNDKILLHSQEKDLAKAKT